MENKKQSDFSKVLGARDILVIAFGAMIGWGWVVSTGSWIQTGGVLGTMLGFALGGIMVFFVGLTYAELTAALPQCGGEHVFSHRAMGAVGSYICTWSIILGYVSVACFEACALPTIITYIYPAFLKGYLYSVAGFDIYASWLFTAVAVALFITWINIRGVKTAAFLQTVLTAVIASVGIILVAASLFTGEGENVSTQIFNSDAGILASVFRVALVTPFFFIGFDVIPQAAEEIDVDLKKIGKILILSIVLAVLFYALVVLAVGLIMSATDIAHSQKESGLVTADAMAKAFGSKMMSKVLIVGGMCGIITSWNSFLMGGSRALYSMAESYMIPKCFSTLHPQFKTPVNALYLVGGLTVLAPFAGRKMLVWIVDAGNFGCCAAYCLVAVSFLILRKKEPALPRPYRVPFYKAVGILAVLMSGVMIICYIVPASGSALSAQEWAIAGGWCVLGAVFFAMSKAKYRENFGILVHIISSEDAMALQASNNEIDSALDRAIDAAITLMLKTRGVSL